MYIISALIRKGQLKMRKKLIEIHGYHISSNEKLSSGQFKYRNKRHNFMK